MIMNILALLISSISAQPCGSGRCDSTRRFDSCYDNSSSCSDSSDCLGQSSSVECNNFVKQYSSTCKQPSFKNIIYPKNFVSLESCPTPRRKCEPYLEFNRIVEFYLTIPNSPKLISFLENKDIKSLERLASKSGSTSNYDAYSAFFYDADSFMALRQGKFSTDFINYFLTRFYYFLNLAYIENIATYNGMDLILNATKKPVDFLDIPSQYANATFGTDVNAARIFNLIISDTTITTIVIDFINILRKQIACSVGKCCPSLGASHKRLTTYELYVNLLVAYLTSTSEITAVNLTQKIDFLAPQHQFAFVVVPYLASTSATTKSALLFDVDVQTHMTLPNTARFV